MIKYILQYDLHTADEQAGSNLSHVDEAAGIIEPGLDMGPASGLVTGGQLKNSLYLFKFRPQRVLRKQGITAAAAAAHIS
jgi:hypothetical protein